MILDLLDFCKAAFWYVLVTALLAGAIYWIATSDHEHRSGDPICYWDGDRRVCE